MWHGSNYTLSQHQHFAEVKGEGADKVYMYVDEDNKAYGAASGDKAMCAVCMCLGPQQGEPNRGRRFF